MTVTSAQTRNALSQLIAKILATAKSLKELKLVSLNCCHNDGDRIINALGQYEPQSLSVLWLNDNPSWWV